jgi:6-phosphogluconolactonase (cycloisomerase 2 family)
MLRTQRPSKAATSLNLVYGESNIGSTSNENSVFGFSNVGGVLSPVTGSPWNTGGTGVYDPGQVKGISEFDADQQVIITPQNFLYAVNGHTNSFSGFSINTTTGALTALAGSPFKSGGSDPVSLAYLSNIYAGPKSWLGVVNKGRDPSQNDAAPNINVFRVDSSTGVPTGVVGGTITLASGTSPSQLITAIGAPAQAQFWAFLDQYRTKGSNTAGLYSYQVLGNATLKAVNFAADPTDPATLGLALNPSYRVIYAGLPTLNEVAVFTYDATTGQVTFNNAVANPGNGVGWLAVGPVTQAGRFLYTSEPGSGTITVYKIQSNGLTLTQAQHATLTGMTPTPANLAFDPTGAYLYCLDNYHAFLHVLSVDSTNGKLTEPNPPTALNVPTGNEPLGIAVAQF